MFHSRQATTTELFFLTISRFGSGSISLTSVTLQLQQLKISVCTNWFIFRDLFQGTVFYVEYQLPKVFEN